MSSVSAISAAVRRIRGSASKGSTRSRKVRLALMLPLGELGEDVAQPMHRAALAIGLRPQLLDGVDQAGGTVGDDQPWRLEPPRGEIAAKAEPVLL